MTRSCAHCGLPLRKKNISADGENGRLYFCCLGCKLSFQMLASPGPERERILDSEIEEYVAHGGIDGVGEVVTWEFSIRGMVCEACVPIVRRVLERTAGVESSAVNFLTGKASVDYRPDVISPAIIKKRLSRYGYRAGERGEDEEEADAANALIRVSLGLFLAVDVMLLSVPEYLGAFSPGEETLKFWLRAAMAALSAPIILWVALPIFRKAWASLSAFRPEMHLLVAIGTAAAYIYSIWGLASRGGHVYFETAAFLPVMITVGKSLEERARRRAREALVDLVNVVPDQARAIRDGRAVDVRPEEIGAGDRVEIKSGERVPCDGAVVEGGVLVNEVMLTGESRPGWRRPAGLVRAGSVVVSGSAVVEAAGPLEQSLLAVIISSIERAGLYRGRRQLVLDRIVSVMTPVVILAGATAGAMVLGSGAGGEQAMLRAMAVILFACPCALSLAAPVARAMAIGRAASMGVAVGDGESLEAGRGPTVMVIDKTGTLTRGMFALEGVEVDPGAGLDADHVIARSAALERRASHPMGEALAREIPARGLAMPVSSDWLEEPGMGVSGVVENERQALGSTRFLGRLGVAVPEWAADMARQFEDRGMSIAVLAREKAGTWRVEAVLGFADEVREDAPSVIRALKDMGVRPVLATGDNQATAGAVAGECGIEDYHADMSPEQKRDLVAGLKKQGNVVWAVGDGVNDAPALAAADVGVAMGRGARLASEAAHATLAGDRLESLPGLIDISARLSRTVRWNLAWAAGYNVAGLPFAFAGLLRPVMSAAAMAISSLSVVLNSTRLGKKPEG